MDPIEGKYQPVEGEEYVDGEVDGEGEGDVEGEGEGEGEGVSPFANIPKGKMVIAVGAFILFIILLRRALKAGGNECGRGWYLVMLMPLFAMLWYSLLLKVYTNYRRRMSPPEINFGEIMGIVKNIRNQGIKVNPAAIVSQLIGGFNVYMPSPWLVIVMFTLFLMFVQFTLSVILMYKHLPGRPFGKIISKALMPSAFMMFISGLITAIIYFVVTTVLTTIPVTKVFGWVIEIIMTIDPSKVCNLFIPHTMLLALMGYGIGCEVVKAIPAK